MSVAGSFIDPPAEPCGTYDPPPGTGAPTCRCGFERRQHPDVLPGPMLVDGPTHALPVLVLAVRCEPCDAATRHACTDHGVSSSLLSCLECGAVTLLESETDRAEAEAAYAF
jgi:hypothetical protein